MNADKKNGERTLYYSSAYDFALNSHYLNHKCGMTKSTVCRI